MGKVVGYKEFTKDQLVDMFEYDPWNGVLLRSFATGVKEVNMVWKQGMVGREYLTTANIGFRGYLIPATHICCILMTGKWPTVDQIIKHLDGDVSNCKWSNLAIDRYHAGDYRIARTCSEIA